MQHTPHSALPVARFMSNLLAQSHIVIILSKRRVILDTRYGLGSADVEDNMLELSKEIESVVGKAPNGFVYVLKNGYVEHKTLSNDEPRVLEYLKQ